MFGGLFSSSSTEQTTPVKALTSYPGPPKPSRAGNSKKPLVQSPSGFFTVYADTINPCGLIPKAGLSRFARLRQANDTTGDRHQGKQS